MISSRLITWQVDIIWYNISVKKKNKGDARYTKPDKPLNAYETMLEYYPETAKHILPILKRLGLNKKIN